MNSESSLRVLEVCWQLQGLCHCGEKRANYFLDKAPAISFAIPGKHFRDMLSFFAAVKKNKTYAQLIWGCLENLQLTTNASAHAS